MLSCLRPEKGLISILTWLVSFTTDGVEDPDSRDAASEVVLSSGLAGVDSVRPCVDNCRGVSEKDDAIAGVSDL